MNGQATAAAPMRGGGAGDQLQEIAFGDVGMAMVGNVAADESAIFPSIQSRFRPGAGHAKPRADPTACPEFVASRPNVTADGGAY